MFPGVDSTVVQCTIESWRGLDHQVDVVMLFNVVGNVRPADRKVLYHKLMIDYLTDGGMVVTCVQSRPLQKLLKVPAFDNDDLLAEMSTEGFYIVLERDIHVYRDLSNPSEEIVRLFAMASGNSSEEVLSAIDLTFAQPDQRVVINKLTIFAK